MRVVGLAHTAILILGMAGVGAWQITDRNASGGPIVSAAPVEENSSTPAKLTKVRAVVGSEKKAFLSDPEVKRTFALAGLDLEVESAGSRDIATTVDLKDYDVAFLSSAPAAEKIKRENKTLVSPGFGVGRPSR